MSTQQKLLIPLSSIFIAHLFISGVVSTTFTITNKCDYTVWPGILSNADAPPLPTTGFSLQKGESKTITAPASWGGRFWGQTYCSQDSTGKFSCVTGDCGSGILECSGSGAAPPATLAEFNLDGYGSQDFFYVSLVDGYNLPLLVVPQGGSGQNCTSTGCVVDLNADCASELKVTSTDGNGVACKGACEAFRSPQYCCDGAYGTPDACKPSSYSMIFKSACPRSYSHAYDDKNSTFACASVNNYQITFCPSPNTRSNCSTAIVNEKPEEIKEETDEATAGSGGFAIDIPGIGKEKQRFETGGRDDDDRERNKKETLQELIPSVGLPIHAVFAFLIPILLTAVQVKFQGKDRSPFEARPKSMWAFLVATIIYSLGFAAKLIFPGTDYSPHIGCVVILAGSFSSAALISILLPSFGGLVIHMCRFALKVARDLADFICSWIYNWIMVIFCKIYGACHGLIYKQNSMKEKEMEEVPV